ncbi:MAG TPA: class I adenylate-forming enzyme family protein [Marmoricola sp.]|nr:class I adenylate-forming enzyme family protein [Marmoricola sp.]
METNLAELLAAAAAAEPGKTALSEASTGRSITWSGLDDLASRVAQGLSARGLVAGYRVLIAVTNRIEFVATYLGVLRGGMVAVPVNPRAVTGELLRMLVDSGARLVVVDETTADVARAAVAGLGEAIAAGPVAGVDASGAVGSEGAHLGHAPPRVVTVGTPAQRGEQSFEELVAGEPRPTPVRADAEALAVLLYTSGTSGTPRAAMLSHRALLANIEQVAAVVPPMIIGRDVVLGVLPLFHVYGLNAVLGQVLRQHARLVLVDGFDPEGVLDLIEDEAVSVVPVAPAAFVRWRDVPSLAERMGPVRLVLSGSAPLAPELVEAFTEATGIAVHQGYGLTEASPVVTSTLCSSHPTARSVGAALPGIRLRLVDDRGREPEPGDSGEILLSGDNLFSGYWPDGVDGPDPDGWFATGDVGYLDSDGDLYLVDRLKELVIVSGFNVYPSEVEEVIAEVEGVAEAAVIGVDDEETGEAVAAYVKPARGAGTEAAALVDAVRQHCAERLARFKQPRIVEVVEDFPHSVTGKVQKGELRAEQGLRHPRRHPRLLEE